MQTKPTPHPVLRNLILGMLLLMGFVTLMMIAPVSGAFAAVGDHPGDLAEAAGEIGKLPVGDDLVGVWTIDGVDYEVIVETRLGPDLTVYAVGECVEVKYDAQTDPFTAHKIEHDDDCDDDGDGGHHGDDAEFKGPIEFLPETDGLIGVWTVGGREFEVKAETELEAEYGPFAVGVCVEIKYDDSTTPVTAIEIEGKREYSCHGDGNGEGGEDHDGEGELYGLVQEVPDGLIGEWKIGNWIFMADGKTEFKPERAEFKIDSMVKVEFYVTNNADGIVNHATEIELKYERDEQEGEHHGPHHGAEGNAFGAIDSFPAGLKGDWVIGGLPYTADDDTRFEQEHGPFATDAWVKVRYHQNAEGKRIADKIETKDDRAGGGQTQFKLVGFVQGMPPQGAFKGEWRVGGELFVANDQTRFEEEHGALALGAYVELTYRLVNGVKLVHEMETEVPPDAGDLNAVGAIEALGNGAVVASESVASVWRIDGQAYAVTDATRLNDSQSALTVGATVVVNSYTAADGSQVATSLTGVDFNQHVFLPLATVR